MILERISALCAERGISVSKLEKECGIGNATITRWNDSSPRIDTIKKVSDYFGVSIEYLLGDGQKKEVKE